MHDNDTKIIRLDGWSWWKKKSAVNGIAVLDKQLAYFKTIRAVHRGEPPFSGFELLAFQIARFMGLQTPDYFYGRLKDGTPGVGSILLPSRTMPWSKLPGGLHGSGLLKKFEDPRVFAGILVFDVFTGNDDRSVGNMLFLPRHSHPWKVFPVDHNHMFRRALWLQKYGEKEHHSPISNFIKKENPKLCELYDLIRATHPGWLKTYIKRIERLDTDRLQRMIERVPHTFLSRDDAKTSLKILRERRDSMKSYFRHYL